MISRLSVPLLLVVVAGLLAPGQAEASPPSARVASLAATGGTPSSAPAAGSCGPGARTLARPGEVVYPELGNGGYRSLHTDIRLRLDTDRQRFLPGTRVDLRQRAKRCLTELSLDFERHGLGRPADGPDLQIDAITIDGVPAQWRFERPTYPGDPLGVDDPDPQAHQASQQNPVGGPDDNPLPPACSPQLRTNQKAHARNGHICPATKLVITPAEPIAKGRAYTVEVRYSGRPGVHHGGGGDPDGWFRGPHGNTLITEPIGNQAWMPLNNHPSSKPTYDLWVTTQRGATVIGNGTRRGVVRNPADDDFPKGSATTHWKSPDPIASYLVLAIVGDYSLTRTKRHGIVLYRAQERRIDRDKRRRNAGVMRQHATATRFLEGFTGRYPFASDGVVASKDGVDVMEMQTMIVFSGSTVGRSVLYHETMHQWWGDNVSESQIHNTFFKEGFAQLAQWWLTADEGKGSFQAGLTRKFDHVWSKGKRFWRHAPSKVTAWTLFDDAPTYVRPGAAYLVLGRVLGERRFERVLRDVQQRYGGGTITIAELEAAFARRLPTKTPACRARLGTFFHQWFDQDARPRITGPGLPGGDFYGVRGCRR